MIIYKVTNTTNNKCYIGQTIQKLCHRRGSHIFYSKMDNPTTLLGKAIKEYGPDTFIWVVLCECKSKRELDEKERYYIELYRSYGEGGYNSTPGAGGKGRKLHQGAIDKISITHRLWWRVTDPDGVVEIVHGMTEYCKKRGITKDRLIKLSLKSPGSTWNGYKCERLGKDYMNIQQIDTLGEEIDTILNYTPPKPSKWERLTIPQQKTKWFRLMVEYMYPNLAT